MVASALTEAGDLEALAELDPGLLYLFVAGPGSGEGVALALPDRGWLLVDGCVTPLSGLPLWSILERWRRSGDDPLFAMVLTHPHRDHVQGLPDVLDRARPERVCVTGPEPPGSHLCQVVRQHLKDAGDSGVTSKRLVAAQVRAALTAIQRWDEDHPGALVVLREGVVLPLPPPATSGGGVVSVTARSPEEMGLVRFFQPQGLANRLITRANEISTVLEVCYGDTRLVLGGDLPRFRPGNKVAVPLGWNPVMEAHPQLGSHHLLKLPHHGSPEAHHPDLMTADSGDGYRAWCLTPFNSSKLPPLTPQKGLPAILERQSPVHLTAVPASCTVQAALPSPGHVSLAQLAHRIKTQPLGEPFLDDAFDIRPGSATAPLDPVWCIALDADGNIAGRWRGRAALEVTL